MRCSCTVANSDRWGYLDLLKWLVGGLLVKGLLWPAVRWGELVVTWATRPTGSVAVLKLDLFITAGVASIVAVLLYLSLLSVVFLQHPSIPATGKLSEIMFHQLLRHGSPRTFTENPYRILEHCCLSGIGSVLAGSGRLQEGQVGHPKPHPQVKVALPGAPRALWGSLSGQFPRSKELSRRILLGRPAVDRAILGALVG